MRVIGLAIISSVAVSGCLLMPEKYRLYNNYYSR